MSRNQEQLIWDLQLASPQGSNLLSMHYQILHQILESCGLDSNQTDYDDEEYQKVLNCEVMKQFKAKILDHSTEADREKARQNLEENWDDDVELADVLAILDEPLTPKPKTEIPSSANNKMSPLYLLDQAKQILKRNLDSKTFEALLQQCGLKYDATGYNPSQVQQFTQLCQSLAAQEATAPQTKNYLEMTHKASEILGKDLEFVAVDGLLTATGLPRTDTYTDVQWEQFMATCQRVKEGKSPEEIAKENGVALTQQASQEMLRNLASVRITGITQTLAEQGAQMQARIVENVEALTWHYLAQQDPHEIQAQINQRTQELLQQQGHVTLSEVQQYNLWLDAQPEKQIQALEGSSEPPQS